ncbi:hypothetical protein WDZ11_22875 (plasmid) [Roseomonas mucosa]|uniref:hypothetical protein n=1 Tax=Roseomonas mucosa TaxID=207340 RepID=UPI0030D08794
MALGAVLLLAGGAFLASPYNTIYPLDLRRVSASLQGAMEGARQVIAPHGPELVAPSARIAAGPAPVSVPPVERERHRPAPPQQQLQEIVGFQATLPAPRRPRPKATFPRRPPRRPLAASWNRRHWHPGSGKSPPGRPWQPAARPPR